MAKENDLQSFLMTKRQLRHSLRSQHYAAQNI